MVTQDLKNVKGPVNLPLTYTSPADNTDQPFRLFLPGAFDGVTPLPLLIVLHGSSGTQDTYFDQESYGDGLYKRLADERNMMVLSPHAYGLTEFRGIGELDVLCVFDFVKKRVPVDEERVLLTGLSMGGTGTSHLCCRYPHLFAGGAPIGSCYEDLTLIPNLRHVPMYYIQGADDWPTYGKEGPIPISKRLQELDYEVIFWVVPDTPHNAVIRTANEVFEWTDKQRAVKHPRSIIYNAYLPIHGRAYWTGIREFETPGLPAKLRAEIVDQNRITIRIENATQIALFPDSPLFDLANPISVEVNGAALAGVTCTANEEILLGAKGDVWCVEVGPRQLRPLTAYRTHEIGSVDRAPTQNEYPESSMGNWMTDAMRHATGTDIAIYNQKHYRGIPLKDGQGLYMIDLFDWIRPYAWCLSTMELTGGELLDILEDNLRNGEKERDLLVQVSGCQYTFDRNRPFGDRIVESDIDLNRTYSVVCEKQTVSRENIWLAGRFERIPYTDLEISIISAAWSYIEHCGGKITGTLAERVKEIN
jgi:hypothetical protein